MTFPARAIVLATGGIGHLYAVTTNPPESEGAGLGMAARAGAMIADPEFVQFHPTAINIGRDPAPLAAEALRGDGAKLINAAGERFMLEIHPDAGARAARHRGAGHPRRDRGGAGRLPRLPRGDRRRDSPSISRRSTSRCIAAGIDPVTQPIPIAPAEHFRMGGILTDANGRDHPRRAVGLRRDLVDGRPWRQPARLEFAARSRGVRAPAPPRTSASTCRCRN